MTRPPMKPRVLAPLAALLLAACASDEPARVTGDLYVVTANGDQIDLLGRPVRLIPESDAFGIDSVLAPLCATRRDELAAIPTDGSPRADSLRRAAQDRAWAARARLLAPHARRQTRTAGEGARFAFDSVPPGAYRVWADAVVQGERWSWTPRVRVRPGDTARVSLGNGNADEDPFRCHWVQSTPLIP